MANYYYNGVLLPEIPQETIPLGYPYIVILNWNNGNIQLLCSQNGFYFDGKQYLCDKNNALLKAYALSSGEWIEDSSQSLKYTEWSCISNGASVVEWSNCDIPNGAPTNTRMYFHASCLVPYIPEGVDGLYYNGVLLPKIPIEILVSHPYCVLFADSGNFNLVFGKGAWYSSPSSGSYTFQIQCSVNEDYQWYTCPNNGVLEANWTFYKVTTGWWGNPQMIWSNHNLRKDSATSATIYGYGSSPTLESQLDKDYKIKGVILNNIATEIRRRYGITTALRPYEMLQLLTKL